jgi:hypothetical protein
MYSLMEELINEKIVLVTPTRCIRRRAVLVVARSCNTLITEVKDLEDRIALIRL